MYGGMSDSCYFCTQNEDDSFSEVCGLASGATTCTASSEAWTVSVGLPKIR